MVRALQAHGGLTFKIVHTGQHCDREMSDVFFEELGIPKPDVSMAAGGGSHAQQTAKIMVAFEENSGGGKRVGVVTLHRPSNVDSAAMMARIGGALKEIAAELPLIFPLHPRTRGNLEKFGIDPGPNVTRVGPQPYMAFPTCGKMRRWCCRPAAACRKRRRRWGCRASRFARTSSGR